MIPLSLVHSSSETCKKIFISSVRRTFRLWRVFVSGGVGGSDWHAGTVLFLSSFGARTLKALSYAPLIVQAGSKVRVTFCPNVLLFA